MRVWRKKEPLEKVEEMGKEEFAVMSGCDCEKRERVKVVYVVVERGSLGMWNSLEPLDWL